MTGEGLFPDRVPVHRALISVYDKTGVVELAAGLRTLGVEIYSTGGTLRALAGGGVEVRPLSEITGRGELIGGRVKTLHPRVHAGILALRGVHDQELAAEGIPPIDLVVVSLYPFERAVSRPGVGLLEALENIDIGGPAMLRAAAKNFPFVAVVTRPQDYAPLLQELAAEGGCLTAATRRHLAGQAFDLVWRYDRRVAAYLEDLARQEDLPDPGKAGPLRGRIDLALDKVLDLRYGENPHQRAAFYREAGAERSPLADAHVLQGKTLSFNNLLDLEAARLLAGEFSLPCAAIIKHANPCGAALGSTPREACEKALATDPLSAFGGIVAFNRELDEEAAALFKDIFLEAIIAPGFAPGALERLGKKKNLRLVCTPFPPPGAEPDRLDYRRVEGGFLVQEADSSRTSEPPEWRVVTRRSPSPEEEEALMFAWRVVKHIRSNAILFAGSDRTLGVGAGQMSRVDSVRLAVMKARAPLAGSVVASDAFFPFRDGLDEAARAGARAAVQPGGSLRDQEVIQAADEHDLAMVFTGRRHFRH